jgi:GNAT superfamily N-acetyltransferase
MFDVRGSEFKVRCAVAGDAAVVGEILEEASRFADARVPGIVMWEQNELAPAHITAEIRDGQFFLAERDGEAAGVIRFQLDDRLFWPDLSNPGESAFIHRLAVRRRFAGRGVSTALLQWAVDRARTLGKGSLRLDCDDDRERLKALYERFGFRLHSHRQVGPYYVARYEYELIRGPAEADTTYL